MATAALVLGIVSLAAAVASASITLFFFLRARRAYISQIAMMLGRMQEMEDTVMRLSEGGYIILRMMMEKGLIDEEEMEIAWRAWVQEPRERAREYAELLREWHERGESEAVLVDPPPTKTSH
ncbi:MAG: hypothetical protein WC889_13225 [Myxococcota bacterium]|jgi:hypothetical protein